MPVTFGIMFLRCGNIYKLSGGTYKKYVVKQSAHLTSGPCSSLCIACGKIFFSMQFGS